MNIAFKYRERTNKSEWRPAEVFSLLRLNESQSYLLKFDSPVGQAVANELSTLGCEELDTGLYSLRIVNFAGEFTLASVQVKLLPSKFTEASMSQMLEDISVLSSSLLFGWGTPTQFQTQNNATEHNSPLYHQLQFLRHSILRTKVGERLQDHLDIIEHNPVNEFERNRRPVPLSQVKYLDSRAMRHLVSQPAKLASIRFDSPLYDSALSKRLTFGVPPSQHLPVKVWQPSKQLSYDTIENRFVKRVLIDCIELVNRFVAHKKLHQSMLNDCQQMLSILTSLSESRYLDGISPLFSFSGPSQVLLKTEGYRGVFLFWMEINQHCSLPLKETETKDLLEGKDLALLYEYWVFMRVIDAVASVLGVERAQQVTLSKDELGERLGHCLNVSFGENITVKFNQSYTRKQQTSYSTPLRPDVVLNVSGKEYVFDAKYKIKNGSFIGEEEDKGIDGVYQRGDLYKMHTYRDALHNVIAAFVAYPGSESIFFTADGETFDTIENLKEVDGVGVIALQPGNASSDLLGFIRVILGQVVK